jgi:hypothetical protein
MLIIILTILRSKKIRGSDAIFKINCILGTSIPRIPNITAPITIPAQHNPNINNHFTICNITINVLSKKNETYKPLSNYLFKNNCRLLSKLLKQVKKTSLIL